MAVRNADTLERLVVELERNAGDVARACADINVSTGWLKRWMREDPKVEAAINDAMDTGVAVLESALIRRAVEGVDEPIFYKENIVGYKRRYSDTNLQFALKGRRREVYGDKQEITANVNVKHLSDDELNARIEMLSQRLGLALPAPSNVIDATFEEIPELDLVAIDVEDLI